MCKEWRGPTSPGVQWPKPQLARTATMLPKSRTKEDEQNLTFCLQYYSNSLYMRNVHVATEYSRHWTQAHVCVETYTVAYSHFAVYTAYAVSNLAVGDLENYKKDYCRVTLEFKCRHTSYFGSAAAILDFWLPVPSSSVRNKPIEKLDPEHVQVAVEISSPSHL
jgi:hypothetical protein